jgi:hypothetical protein
MTSTTKLPGLPAATSKPSVEVRPSGLVVTSGYKLRDAGRLARRRMYKRERRPARHDDSTGNMPPVGMPDATPFEIVSSINAYAKAVLKIDVGRTNGYDAQKDEYSVIAKAGRWETPRDYKIPGAHIAMAIHAWRCGQGDPARPTDPLQYLRGARAV